MQHGAHHLGIVGSVIECVLDHLLQQPADGTDRRRIPNRPQQRGLEKTRHPPVFRIGIDQLHEHVAWRQHRPFRHGLDFDGEKAAVIIKNAHPELAIERHVLLALDVFRFIDVLAVQIIQQGSLQ